MQENFILGRAVIRLSLQKCLYQVWACLFGFKLDVMSFISVYGNKFTLNHLFTQLKAVTILV